MEIPRKGCLEDHPLPRLLLELHDARFTGRMELRRDRVHKSLLFDSGVPIFAESNLASESLGVQLMDAGRISRADYSRVASRVTREGCREGQALLDLGLIEPRGLFLALKEQVRARVVECFGWARGEFETDADVTAPEGAQLFRADVHALVQEGIETHWSIDRVLGDLGPRMGQYAARTRKLARIQQRLRNDDDVTAFLDVLDGRHTLWEALQKAASPRARAAAWLLDAAGALAYTEVPAGSGDEPLDVEIVLGEEREAAPAPPSADPAPRSGGPAETDPPAAAALRAEILEKFEQLEGLDPYDILGIDERAATEEIKAAYLRAAKAYHPDALARAHLDAEVRARANKVFAEIGRAYEILSNPERRRAYDDAGSQEQAAEADRVANAEGLYRKGEVLLRAGNFKGAIEFLKPAVDLWPDEPEYQSALGWALYKKMPSEPQAARQHLGRAAEQAPDDAVVVFRLSVVLRALGETVAASALAERARQLDPKLQ